MRKEEGMKKRFFGILAALLLIVQVMPVAAAEELPMENTIDMRFTDIDGNSVSTQGGGKPKLLVFFKVGCLNCKNTLESIAQSDWLLNGEAEVCAINIGAETEQDIKNYRDTNCAGSNISFVAPIALQGQNIMDDYARLIKLTPSVTPLTVMLDKDNKIQYMTEGQQSASDIETKYLPTLKAGGVQIAPTNQIVRTNQALPLQKRRPVSLVVARRNPNSPIKLWKL